MDKTREIEEARAQLAKLEKAQAAHEGQTYEQRIAESLHDNLCHHNHIDACDWTYGSWENPRGKYGARSIYLRMAVRMLGVADFLTVDSIIGKIKEKNI